MTFYPACLSLILELSRNANIYGKRDFKRCIIQRALKEEDLKSNPVLQRVKLIMSVGLMLVHLQRYVNILSRADLSKTEQDLIFSIIKQTCPFP